MTKEKTIRLNKDKRQILLDHAHKCVTSVPLVPVADKALRAKVEKAYRKALSIVFPKIEKKYPAAEMRVLNKYDKAVAVDCVMLKNTDNDERPQAFCLCFNPLGSEHGVWSGESVITPAGEIDPSIVNGPNVGATGRIGFLKRLHEVAGCPLYPYGTGQLFLAITNREDKVFGQLKELQEELAIKLSGPVNERAKLLGAYRALINESRTYQQVAEVWPEAADVRHLIDSEAVTAISILSSETLALIKADIKARRK